MIQAQVEEFKTLMNNRNWHDKNVLEQRAWQQALQSFLNIC
jgi:hypothetical protein